MRPNLIPALIVVVVGGLGSLKSLLAGSLIIGHAETFGKARAPDGRLGSARRRTAFPLFAGNYSIKLLQKILISGVFAMSLDLLMGSAGRA